MSATTIAGVHARQILDSRGRPTVEAEVALAGGVVARASAPSGASTGKAEAFELRDGGEAWEGLGVNRAVGNVRETLARFLLGRDAEDQADLDMHMRLADGTPNLARLGANAILAVSLASARAAAMVRGQPLWRRFADLSGAAPSMPMPMVNILSGGMHAGGGMDVQDYLAIPVGARSFSEALDWMCRVRSAAAGLCAELGLSTLLADEGGLSPGFARPDEALSLMMQAFDRAGLRPGEDVAIAVDVASSGLIDADGAYSLLKLGRRLSASEMIEMQAGWIARYPIVSIEDGLGEDDWLNWPAMTERLGTIQIVGDDLFATQPDRIRQGVRAGVANAVLIKANQNGTVTGALEAVTVTRAANYATVISARSGETEDEFLADFAVGVGGGQIKIGSVRNSERMAKYNQLSRIEELGLPWTGRSGLAPL